MIALLFVLLFILLVYVTLILLSLFYFSLGQSVKRHCLSQYKCKWGFIV